MSSLKLKWDASGGKTIYKGVLVLVGFMWSLSVLTWLFSLWSDWLSSSTIFSENNEDTLQSLSLNVCDQTLTTCRKRIKGRKEKETKQNKTKQNKRNKS